jgi:hypothetical protein
MLRSSRSGGALVATFTPGHRADQRFPLVGRDQAWWP